MTRFPEIGALVPHAGPMRLLHEVVHHDDEETRCRVRAEDSAVLADRRGRIGSHVALEWMAQCVAVRGGLIAAAEGASPRPGLFLGARRARLPGGVFVPGERFEVSASLVRGRGVGAHAFACTLRREGEEDPIGDAAVQVMIYESLDALRADASGAGGGAWR